MEKQPTPSSVVDDIQNTEARLRALQARNVEADKELKSLDRKLVDIRARKTADIKIANRDRFAAKAKLASSRQKFEKLQDKVDTLKLFLARMGLTLGCGEYDESPKSVHFKSLLKSGEDCVLYFSALDLPVFNVIASCPQFPEFDDLAAETNKSQNFVYLLVMARQYYLQYAHNPCNS